MHQAYVALPPGRDRFDCLSAALRLLGWELRERRQARGNVPLADNTLAWSHLPAEPETPGLLRIGGGWDPRLVWALSEVSGQLAVAHRDDRTRGDHHFAVGYAGVRLVERAGDEDESFSELNRLVHAAAGLDPLLFRVEDDPEAEVVSYVPGTAPLDTVPELSRILVADVADLDPPDGWAWRTADPYGARYWALQRHGPLDESLLKSLASLGEVMAITVTDGGAVRRRHLGAGHDDAHAGSGWEPITDAWKAHAPHLLLPPPEIDWPPLA